MDALVSYREHYASLRASSVSVPDEIQPSETMPSWMERWECNECGFPCRIVIFASDEKLPRHLRGKSRFTNKQCPCNEDNPVWKQV